MSKGMTVKSRNTGLPYTVVEVNGNRIMVKDDLGITLNHWFDSEVFLCSR